VLAFLLVASGCGGSPDTATPATTVAPAATQAPTTAAPLATTVKGLRDEDYGSRGFSATDPEGNLWSFGTYTPAQSVVSRTADGMNTGG